MLKRVLYKCFRWNLHCFQLFLVWNSPLLSFSKCGTVPHFCSGNLKMWDSPTKCGTVSRSVHCIIFGSLHWNHRYRPEIPEPAPSLSWHGAPIGVFVFSRKQNNSDLCMCTAVWAWRFDAWNAAWSAKNKDCGRILYAFVSACVVGKKTKIKQNTPNWSSMADDAIARSAGVV